MEEVRELESKF